MLDDTIRRLRENSGFTQQQVAEVLNIDRSTYAYYETGRTSPSINTIRKLVKLFNVSYEMLLDAGYNELTFSDNKPAYKTAINSPNIDISKQIYTLSKDEMNLVLHYRLLSEEGKMELMEQIKDK